MKPASLEVHPVGAARWSDFVGFFEGDAFADNPKWKFCYCQFLHVDHRHVVWAERTAEENRAAAGEGIRAGRMQGYLAYRDGRVVGWCNAAPRLLMRAFDAEPDPEAGQLGQIGCFLVAAAHRRTGVATALLEAACNGFRRAGLKIAEGSPVVGAASDAQNHFGPLPLFLAAGFRVHRCGEGGRVWVRRALD